MDIQFFWGNRSYAVRCPSCKTHYAYHVGTYGNNVQIFRCTNPECNALYGEAREGGSNFADYGLVKDSPTLRAAIDPLNRWWDETIKAPTPHQWHPEGFYDDDY